MQIVNEEKYDELAMIRDFLDIQDVAGTPIEQNTCSKCIKYNGSSSTLCHGITWSISLRDVCKFTRKAFIQIRIYRPNIMLIGKHQLLTRFAAIWAQIINNLGNTRVPEQHFSGKLVQDFHQSCCKKREIKPRKIIQLYRIV